MPRSLMEYLDDIVILSRGIFVYVDIWISIDVESKYNSNCVISSDIHYTIIVRTLSRDTAV